MQRRAAEESLTDHGKDNSNGRAHVGDAIRHKPGILGFLRQIRIYGSHTVWTIVFDGPGPCGTEPSPEYLTVIYAGHGVRDSADDRIVELVGALPDRAMALVYTSDAALRARLHAMGAQVVGARALLKDIAAVPTSTTASPKSTWAWHGG